MSQSDHFGMDASHEDHPNGTEDEDTADEDNNPRDSQRALTSSLKLNTSSVKKSETGTITTPINTLLSAERDKLYTLEQSQRNRPDKDSFYHYNPEGTKSKLKPTEIQSLLTHKLNQCTDAIERKLLEKQLEAIRKHQNKQIKIARQLEKIQEQNNKIVGIHHFLSLDKDGNVNNESIVKPIVKLLRTLTPAQANAILDSSEIETDKESSEDDVETEEDDTMYDRNLQKAIFETMPKFPLTSNPTTSHEKTTYTAPWLRPSTSAPTYPVTTKPSVKTTTTGTRTSIPYVTHSTRMKLDVNTHGFPKFSGKGNDQSPSDFLSWAQDAIHYQFPDKPTTEIERKAQDSTKIHVMGFWFEDVARTWFVQYKKDYPCADYAHFIQKFLEQFDTEITKITAQLEAGKLIKGKNESVSTFALRVQKLCLNAYATASPEIMNMKISDIFQAGLPQALKKAVCLAKFAKQPSGTKLSFEEMKNIAAAEEMAEKVSEITNHSDIFDSDPISIGQVMNNRNPYNTSRKDPDQKNKPNQFKHCKLCNKGGHSQNDCFQNPRNQTKEPITPKKPTQTWSNTFVNTPFTPTDNNGMLTVQPQGGNNTPQIAVAQQNSPNQQYYHPSNTEGPFPAKFKKYVQQIPGQYGLPGLGQNPPHINFDRQNNLPGAYNYAFRYSPSMAHNAPTYYNPSQPINSWKGQIQQRPEKQQNDYPRFHPRVYSNIPQQQRQQAPPRQFQRTTFYNNNQQQAYPRKTEYGTAQQRRTEYEENVPLSYYKKPNYNSNTSYTPRYNSQNIQRTTTNSQMNRSPIYQQRGYRNYTPVQNQNRGGYNQSQTQSYRPRSPYRQNPQIQQIIQSDPIYVIDATSDSDEIIEVETSFEDHEENIEIYDDLEMDSSNASDPYQIGSIQSTNTEKSIETESDSDYEISDSEESDSQEITQKTINHLN